MNDLPRDVTDSKLWKILENNPSLKQATIDLRHFAEVVGGKIQETGVGCQ